MAGSGLERLGFGRASVLPHFLAQNSAPRRHVVPLWPVFVHIQAPADSGLIPAPDFGSFSPTLLWTILDSLSLFGGQSSRSSLEQRPGTGGPARQHQRASLGTARGRPGSPAHVGAPTRRRSAPPRGATAPTWRDDCRHPRAGGLGVAAALDCAAAIGPEKLAQRSPSNRELLCLGRVFNRPC